ncbi:MAG: hypothetical protein GQ535_00335 [Rhodobacteraceae bacterium]|nr:hypothetical protein [Paracoccaceae bacterium]
MTKNNERVFVGCLKQYCRTNDVDLKSYSHDWIFHLSKGGHDHIIIGYDLGVNSSSSAQVCSDKAATFSVLDGSRITCVPHHLFLEPWKMQFVEKDGNWGEIISLHDFYGGRTVIKQNDGTGGRSVFLIENRNELEAAVLDIFSKENSVALSPFLEIDHEIRFYVSQGQVVLCYEKLRPFVIGDGTSSVFDLAELSSIDLKSSNFEEIEWNHVPSKDEKYLLNWRHNLGGGAGLKRLKSDIFPEACDLALNAFRTLGLKLASVDVVFANGNWLVLEVNTGIMIEKAYQIGAISRVEAQEIYDEMLSHLEFN